MNPLSILQITELAGAKLEQGDGQSSVERISTDSRTIKKGELFVALHGENFDGHKFVEAAAKAGVRTIALTCGGTPEHVLRNAGALAIYYDPADLLIRYAELTSIL